MRARVCVVVVLLAALAAAQEQAPRKRSCSISGTVVRADGGQPIAKVKLSLSGGTPSDSEDGSGPAETATTEADGAFHFDDLVCGRYRLEAEHTGYLRQEFGQRAYMSQGAPIQLAPGQALSGLTLKMVASAVIAGKVTDADGELAPGVSVSALRPYWLRGRRRTTPMAYEKTNDLGEYRLHDLAPGKYYVRAGGEDRGGAYGFFIRQFQEPVPAAGAQPKFVDTATYYSGTTQLDQATPVELRAGDELRIDLSLLRFPAVKVRGRVVGGGRKTFLVMSGEGNLEPAQTEVNANGTFELPQVAAGTYTLVAMSLTEDDITDPSDMIARMKRGSARIIVGSSDLDGVVINLTPAGQVALHGQLSGLQNGADYRKIVVTAVSDEAMESDDLAGEMTGQTGMGIATVKRDGSFDMKGLRPGRYRVAVNSIDEKLRDYFVRSMTLAGADVLADGLLVTGAAPPPLLIVVSNAGAGLEGNVADAKGQSQVGVTVAAIPAPEYRKQPDLYQTETTDQNGHFVFKGLRPGEYTALAFDGLQGEEYQDPDFLGQYESRGKRVQLRERETGNAQLTLISVAPE